MTQTQTLYLPLIEAPTEATSSFAGSPPEPVLPGTLCLPGDANTPNTAGWLVALWSKLDWSVVFTGLSHPVIVAIDVNAGDGAYAITYPANEPRRVLEMYVNGGLYGYAEAWIKAYNQHGVGAPFTLAIQSVSPTGKPIITTGSPTFRPEELFTKVKNGALMRNQPLRSAVW